MNKPLKVRAGHNKDMYFAVREHSRYENALKRTKLYKTEIIRIFYKLDNAMNYVLEQNKGK